MRSGVAEHLVAARPGAALLKATLLGQRTRRLEPLDQLVPYLLELGQVGDVPLGA
jgi:hypothetical protein